MIGDVATIETLTRDRIAGYYRRRYKPENMVVAVAGAIDHAAVVRLVRAAFAGRLDRAAAPLPPRPGSRPGRGPARRIARAGRARPSRPTSSSAAPRWPAATSAGSPSACSTTRSAAG